MPVQNLRCLHQSSNIKWEEKNGVVTGMFCELCTRHKCKDKRTEYVISMQRISILIKLCCVGTLKLTLFFFAFSSA